jgi:hypothetical protein
MNMTINSAHQWVLALIILTLAGCQNSSNEETCCAKSLSDRERKMYRELGEAGIGDAYRAIEDNNDIGGHARESKDDSLKALALKNGAYQSNIEYARQLYKVAILKPTNSPARAVLLDEAKKRLEIGLRGYLTFHYVTGRAERDSNYYQMKANGLNSYDILYQDIVAAQQAK